MEESLIIKNFVGIKYLKIDLKKLNILIGPQATGKSVVAKLFFYFKNFIWELIATVENEQSKRELDKRLIERFEIYFPPDSWGQGGFSVRYQLQDVFIEMAREKEVGSKLSLRYSDYFKKELEDCRSLFDKMVEKQTDTESHNAFALYEIYKFEKLHKEFIKNIKKRLGKTASYSQLFIPAGRSFFANLRPSVFTILSNDNAIDPFLIKFGAFYENAKRQIQWYKNTKRKYDRSFFKENNNKTDEEQIATLVESILCGKYINEEGRDYLKTSDGRKIKIANSSSGQQEILPLALILEWMPLISDGEQTIYIEEPETHLFPTAQRHIIELIATVFNHSVISFSPLQFLITTHSPYMLTAINNLIQAKNLYNELNDSTKLQRLEKIVPYERMLSSDDLAVYSLEKESCENIICPDTGLIRANIIDEEVMLNML